MSSCFCMNRGLLAFEKLTPDWTRCSSMVRYPLAPKRAALLNVDMQNCFVENSPIAAQDGMAILERVNRLASECRAAGTTVIHTAHLLREDGSNAGLLAENVEAVRSGVINKGSVSSRLHPALNIEAKRHHP